MQRTTLHGPVKQKPSILLISKLHNGLPQPNRIRNVLQPLPQNPTPVCIIMLQFRSLHPQLHRIGNRLNTPCNHRLCLIRISQPTSLQPHILVLGTLLTPFLYQLPSCLKLPC
ncbi:hypothetical protein V8G54_026308 [Vigna mungo]|uniref:Uncharacterized protein n=1 Tax=Vigna mungo TaxID=3915 RepID=A0AAQ3MZV6_VIGMU